MEITTKILQNKLKVINRITNRPQVAAKDNCYQVGHYFLDVNKEGLYAIQEILIPTTGASGRIDRQMLEDYKTDREMLCWMDGFINGVVDDFESEIHSA